MFTCSNRSICWKIIKRNCHRKINSFSRSPYGPCPQTFHNLCWANNKWSIVKHDVLKNFDHRVHFFFNIFNNVYNKWSNTIIGLLLLLVVRFINIIKLIELKRLLKRLPLIYLLPLLCSLGLSETGAEYFTIFFQFALWSYWIEFYFFLQPPWNLGISVFSLRQKSTNSFIQYKSGSCLNPDLFKVDRVLVHYFFYVRYCASLN